MSGTELPSKTSSFLRSPFFWFALCILLSFLALAYPMYVIRPFRHQGAVELRAALFVVRTTPFLEAIFIAIAFVLLALVWRRESGIARRVYASCCALLVLVLAVLSHVNIYELMFHPLEAPHFSPASKTKLDGNEEVIAVRIRGTARAYPIRIMSYHHIVNDVLGGLPIVATY